MWPRYLQGAGASHDGWVASSQTTRDFGFTKITSAARNCSEPYVFAVKNADPSHEKWYYENDNLNSIYSITKMARLVLLQFQWMKKLINLWFFWNSKEEVRDKVSIGHPAYKEYKEWLESVRVRKPLETTGFMYRTKPRPNFFQIIRGG